MIPGGAETTRTTLARALILFSERNDLWEQLAADPAAIPTAVEELLRWITPLNNMFRTVDRGHRGRRRRDGGRRPRRARLPVGQPRRGGVRPIPTSSTSPATPTRTSPSASGPTSASAPTSPGSRCASRSRSSPQRFTNLRPVAAPAYEANVFVKAVERFDVAFARDALTAVLSSVGGRRSPRQNTDSLPLEETTNTIAAGPSAVKRSADVWRVPRYGGMSRRLRSDDRRCTPTVRTRPRRRRGRPGRTATSALSSAAKCDAVAQVERRDRHRRLHPEAGRARAGRRPGATRASPRRGRRPASACTAPAGWPARVGSAARHVRRDPLDERRSTAACVDQWMPSQIATPVRRGQAHPALAEALHDEGAGRRGEVHGRRLVLAGALEAHEPVARRRRRAPRTTTGRRRGGGPTSSGIVADVDELELLDGLLAQRVRRSPAGRRSAGRRPRGRGGGGRSRAR